ncbi:MAG: PilC/PilY family type IV pilus protein [Gammaproteobacteria bacterium]|nr:PilC/PilY family type IV pilus protein [Gammaproteobacteria bacterium]
MLSKLQKLRYAALGACLGALAGQPVLADDTEIFTGHSLDAGQANVLFIIDTSGSMGSTVDWELPYDVAEAYDGDCDPNQIYWAPEGDSAPDCGVDDWVYDTAFVCRQASTALSTSGFYTDRFAQYKADKEEWNDLANNHDWMVECEADTGRHGDGSSNIHVYAAEDIDAPFSTDPEGPNNIDWVANYKGYTAYAGNYLNYINDPSNYILNRLDVVKIVGRNTLSAVSGINVGMMRFDSYGSGGQVTRAMAPIDGEFTPLTGALDDYAHGGSTPLSETMFEATQYLMGGEVVYGDTARGNFGSLEPSVDDATSGTNYVSPIANQCQKNFVVLLTDGEPTSDTDADTKISELPGFSDATGQTVCVGNCLDELAAYVHNHDLHGTLDGDQNVDVFTIGFHTDQQLLEDTATRGGGIYYKADSAEELTTAFTEILDNIIERDTTFTAPAVAVNTFNRLTHRDELFISMFRPSNNPHWPGNLKRYRLDNTGGEKSIYDATNRPAINPATGTFYEDAKSYWTIGEPDGYDTTLGGFSSRLHANRNVYTVTSGATAGILLSTEANRVHEDNTALTEAMLGVSAAERTGLIRWARGVDDAGESLKILGDPLHSRPIVLSYGGSVANPDLTLFYATNDGYFHAIDPMAEPTEDMEVFSFIPQELLPRLESLRANNRNNPPKFYGLDGPMSYLIYGDNGNRVVDAGERAFIYLGMRRGGRNYYAIEVTDRDNPKLAWTIRGGTGQFSELGQTWSELTPARVKIDGSARDVLVFGGGYDTRQDAAGGNVDDRSGRAVYMVDALTGNLLWWASHKGDNPSADLPLGHMKNSIPSDLRVIDINGDHLHDRIYVGDMSGQMWRFDIHNETATNMASLVTGGEIADIGTGGDSGNRRIYYPPSVALVADEHLGSFLAVSFGTGHRANPLGTSGKTVTDRFYMLRDPYVFSPALDNDGDPTYATAKDNDFYDVTSDLTPSTADLNGHDGWRITLDHEEKVLAKSLTADERIFFTSYLPEAPDSLTCNPTGALGTARAYSVAIGTGEPEPFDEPDDPDDPDDPGPDGGPCNGRCVPTQGPIPPEPVLVFTEPEPCPVGQTCAADPCEGIADVAMVIGTELKDPSICTAPVRTYWYADGDN